MKNGIINRWPLIFTVVFVALSISYYRYSQCLYPVNKSLFIEIYGILCTVLVVFLALYSVRNRTYRYRLGSKEGWLKAHYYTGIISVILLLMHFEFRPSGIFGIFLSILFFLVIISGVIGSLIYSYVPLHLTKYGRAVKTEEEISASIAKCLNEADALISGTSEDLKKIYDAKIKPYVQQGRTAWKYLLTTEKEVLEKRKELLEECKSMIRGHDIHDLDTLSGIVIDKEKLSFTLAKLQLQRVWLDVHMPLTCALLAATVIHVVTVLYY